MKLINLKAVRVYLLLLLSDVFCSFYAKSLKDVQLPKTEEIARDINKLLFSNPRNLNELINKKNKIVYPKSKVNPITTQNNRTSIKTYASDFPIALGNHGKDSSAGKTINTTEKAQKVPSDVVGPKHILSKNSKRNVTNVNKTLDQEILNENTNFINKYIKEFFIDKNVENSKKEKQELFFPHRNIQVTEYNKILKLSPSNANSKLSLPFFKILLKIEELIGIEKTKQARSEIIRLRKLDIETVTDIIIGYSDAIQKNLESESYWYYYYIVSKVILKGRLIPDAQNANKTKSEFWRLKKPQRLLEKGQDAFYDYFVENDAKYEKDLDYLRTITLMQVKNATLGRSDYIKNFLSFYLPGNLAMTPEALEKLDKEKPKLPKIREWVGRNQTRTNLIFSDFEHNTNLYYTIKRTLLYGFLNSFPKGIIHHLHMSAAFNMYDIIPVISEKMKNDLKLKNAQYPNGKLILIVKTELYLEDKTRADSKSYLDIPFPRILIIDDFMGLMNKIKNNSFREQEEKFKDNYILGDGRCVLNSVSSVAAIDPDIRAYLYFKKCKNSVLYSHKNFVAEFSRNNFLKGVEPIEKLISFLETHSHVLEEKLNLQNEFLPSSYRDLLYNIKDQLSVAVWFKFEIIFGLYEKIFDNNDMFKILTEYLAAKMHHQKVLGIEFRQGYDVGKPNSRIEIIREFFSEKNSKGPLLIAFIVPGRKITKNHKLRQIIKNLDNAKALNQSDITGFDFFGYEDDPFSGARNFFPSTLQCLFEEEKRDSKNNKDNNANNNNLSNDFEFLLDALRRGHKFFLHAGETLYFPNYPVTNDFLKKYYINDNLIHAALLPNMARLGHGFAANSNELIMSIYRKKGISLEICPTSNQALLYYDVKDSPIVNLLRSGLSVTVSPDDPGLFHYRGVTMDWFNLIMNTDLKVSEYYLLLRNSVMKFSSSEFPSDMKPSKLLAKIKDGLEHFFKIEKFAELKQKIDHEKMRDMFKITDHERNERIEKYCKLQAKLKDNFIKNKNKFLENIDPTVNIYDIDDIMKTKEKNIKCN